MRSVGAAEKARAHGKRHHPSIWQAHRKPRQEPRGHRESSYRIESMRRMVLTAAKAMDELGNAEARVWVSAVNGADPGTCQIVDEAIRFTAVLVCRNGLLSPACMQVSARCVLLDGRGALFVVGRSGLPPPKRQLRLQPEGNLLLREGSDSAVAFSDPDPVANQFLIWSIVERCEPQRLAVPGGGTVPPERAVLR